MKKISLVIFILLIMFSMAACKDTAEYYTASFPERYTDNTTAYGVRSMNYGENDHAAYHIDDRNLFAFYYNSGSSYKLAEDVSTTRTVGDSLIYVSWKNNNPTLVVRNCNTGKEELAIAGIVEHIIVNSELIVCGTAAAHGTEPGALYKVNNDKSLIKLAEPNVRDFWGFNGALFYSKNNGTICRINELGQEVELFSLSELYVLPGEEKDYENSYDIWFEYYVRCGVSTLICPQTNTLYCLEDRNNQSATLTSIQITDSGVRIAEPTNVFGEITKSFGVDAFTIQLGRNDSFLLSGQIYEYSGDNARLEAHPIQVSDSIYEICSPGSNYLENGFFYADRSGRIRYKPRYFISKPD